MATTTVTLDTDYTLISTAAACFVSTVGGGVVEIINGASAPAAATVGHQVSNLEMKHLLIPEAGNWYAKVISPRSDGEIIVTTVG